VVAQGPPEKAVEVQGSYTAEYLKPKLIAPPQPIEQKIA